MYRLLRALRKSYKDVSKDIELTFCERMSVISHVRSRMTSFFVLCFVLFWWSPGERRLPEAVMLFVQQSGSRYSFDHLVYLILADNDPDARYSF